MKSNGGGFSRSDVEKNDAVSAAGKTSGNSSAKNSAIAHREITTAPARSPRLLASARSILPRLVMIETIT